MKEIGRLKDDLAHVRSVYDFAKQAAEIDSLRARNAELEEALKDTLRMLEAAYRQLGMWSKDNPRITKARAVLTKGAP